MPNTICTRKESCPDKDAAGYCHAAYPCVPSDDDYNRMAMCSSMEEQD